MKPIELTLYDPETNEVIQTFTRSFVPWEILKRAIRMKKIIGAGDISEDDLDELAGLVVAVFGDQFSLEQVNKGTDVSEMITVINSVIGRASQFVEGRPANGNPPPPAG
jgi:hypothetical protein